MEDECGLPERRAADLQTACSHQGKILVLGLSKTGTTSLHVALRLLGFRSVHYADEQGTKLKSLVTQNLHARRRLFSGAEEYQAFSDWVGLERWHLFCRLDKQYPGSKFILLVRDLDSWLESCEEHVTRNRVNEKYTGTWLSLDRERAERTWRVHQRRIRGYFRGRPGDFLEMNICAGDGWAKLCPFLNVPLPGRPFPWANKKKQ